MAAASRLPPWSRYYVELAGAPQFRAGGTMAASCEDDQLRPGYFNFSRKFVGDSPVSSRKTRLKCVSD